MVFPKKGLYVSSGAAALLWFIGVPAWAIGMFAFLTFLGMGGMNFLRVLYRTLPRDLWMGKNFFKLVTGVKKFEKNNTYISDCFTETAKKNPNKVAILFQERKLTFKELDELSNRIANMLRTTTSLQRGDSMAMFMENCPEFVAIYLALSKIGVTAAFINHNLRGKGLAHCIKVANSYGVIFSASLSEALAEVKSELDDSVSQKLYNVGGESSIADSISLESAISKCSAAPPPPVLGKSSSDLVCYIYTSGTTGLPKACKIKHHRFYGLQKGVNIFAGITSEDIVYVALPLYHTNGGVLSCGQMIFTGATIAIRSKFSASNFWTDCIKYQCTMFFYIGEVCRYVLAQPKRPVDTQHCVRLMVGNGLRPHVWTEFVRRFRIAQVAEFYGSTEGNVGMINPFNKVGACGFLSVALAALNPVSLVKVDENGEYIKDSQGFCVPAGPNETGEMVGKIRANVVTSHFEGYSDPNSTRKKVMTDVFTKGDKYFLSGDILRQDEDGFLFFCDRTGDTFRWKGENVSTMEVEAAMQNILSMRDVTVYGVEVPGSEGRAGMAAIVGDKDSVDLAGLAQQLFLALPAYAVPLFVRLVPAAELTGTFKLKKVKLRNEGFAIKLTDPIFFLNSSSKTYEVLTEEVYQKIQDGKARL